LFGNGSRLSALGARLRAQRTLMACAFLLAACEPPTEPIGEIAVRRVLVHSVLDLSKTAQVVVLERTLKDPFLGYAIRNAAVTIRTPNGESFGAVEIPPDTNAQRALEEPAEYMFTTSGSSLGFSPGATYELYIETQQGDTIRGVTTIPTAVPAFTPTLVGRFDRLSDTLRYQWPRVPGARGYEVGIYVESTSRGAFRKSWSVFTDTAVVIPGNAENLETGNGAFPINTRVTVVVAAVDENYHTYYQAAIGPFTGAPESRLEGALGVFGSMVPILVRRYDVR